VTGEEVGCGVANLTTMGRFASWLLAAALLLGGCAPHGPDLRGLRGKYGGTLRLASESDLRTLDTAIAYDTPSWRFIRLIYDGLMDYGDDATLEPAVARELPTIVDGRVFTFQLRDDVWFHHGRQVVAEDFRYALERILSPTSKSPATGFFTNIVGAQEYVDGQADHVAGIRCPGELTLEITLIEPDVAFLNVLTMPFAYPIPKELVEQYTDPDTQESDWSTHAVGCGPYRLAEWSRGVRIRVEKFDRYYRDLGYFDAIEQQFQIPEFMQLMMFERGEVDFSSIPIPDFDRVNQDPRLSKLVHAAPDNAIYYCSMNTELKPFTDQRVRQAFNYAVDKERIIRILNHTGVPASGVLPPGMPGFNKDLKGYPYDPAKARQLLAEAGYGDGLSLEFTTRTRPKEKAWAEAIQQDLRAVGVNATINPIAFPKWLDLSSKRGEMLFTVNGWWQDYPDPSNFLDVLLNGDRITAQNSPNRAFYNNPEVNRLLRQAAGMTDLTARLKLYQRIEAMVVDDAPWIFVYYPNTYVMAQPWVKNFQIHPVWSSRDERIWFGPAEEATP